jgi:hypothetical protein
MAATEHKSANVIVGMLATAETIATAGMSAILKNLETPAIEGSQYKQWCCYITVNS